MSKEQLSRKRLVDESQMSTEDDVRGKLAKIDENQEKRSLLLGKDNLKSKETLLSNLEESTLNIGAVLDVESLYKESKHAVRGILQNVTDVIIYLRDFDTEKLTCNESHYHNIPHEGIAWNTVQQGRCLQYTGIHAADPLSELLPSGVAPLQETRRILCSPIIEPEDQLVQGLVIAVCNQLSTEDEIHLIKLEKHISVCYRRLQQTRELVRNQHSKTINHSHNNSDSILQLSAELHGTDASKLQVKVFKYLQDQIHCQCSTLLFLTADGQHLYCKVVGEKILSEDLRLVVNQSSFSPAVERRKILDLDRISLEDRAMLSDLLGFEIVSLLCVPVENPESNEIIALACAFNKTGGQTFSVADESKIRHCYRYTSTILTSTLAFQREHRVKVETQSLLQVAKTLFTHLGDVTELLKGIMQEARNLTHAERCSLFLVDNERNELVAEVFDGLTPTTLPEPVSEIRLPICQGIAGHVATNGKVLNIRDAYSHPLFYRALDESTGFKTRNILCFPIKDDNGCVIGVAQLCNKISGETFTMDDEEVAMAFSVFCGISIEHSLMYKRIAEAKHRNDLANELMLYRLQLVAQEEVNRFVDKDIENVRVVHCGIDRFEFVARSIQDSETISAVLGMFQDMGFLDRWRIPKTTLIRFCLMAKNGYRDTPYHNWTHAFSVAHFCYQLHKNLNLTKFLSDVECFALFVACLCHDIDHRGTNNAFQVSSRSVLAALYSSEGSVLERHHFAQTICIFNSEGCNILENVNSAEFHNILDLIRDIILATDIAHHLRIMPDLQQISADGLDADNSEHHNLILSLLMTACDLSDQTKNWANTKLTSECLYREFFKQGDLEKAMGSKPQPMMDRDIASIPEQQIEFLNTIAIPVYRTLADIFPAAETVYGNIYKNRSRWDVVRRHTDGRQILMSDGRLDFNNIDVDNDSM